MIKYANTFGGFSLEVDGVADSGNAASDGIDQWAIGGTYNGENWLVGGAWKSKSDQGVNGGDWDSWGIAANFRTGDWRTYVGYNELDDESPDNTQGFTIGTGVRKGVHQLELAYDRTEDGDNAAIDKLNSYNVEYDYHFNRNARIYFAANYRDPDAADSSWDIWAPGFRIDF